MPLTAFVLTAVVCVASLALGRTIGRRAGWVAAAGLLAAAGVLTWAWTGSATSSP